jgi:hypothetical protein
MGSMSTSPRDGYRWASIVPVDYSRAIYVIAFLALPSMAVLARILFRSNVFGVDDGTVVVARLCETAAHL